MKKSILKIMFCAVVALIIPLAGNQFVEGWNWGPGDFVFAWVFLVVMGVAILLTTKRIINTKYKVAIGTVIFLIFAFIWVMLATG